MAQKVEVHLEDDLDGGPADDTVILALDDKDYEIDLSTAENLREALRPCTEAARKITRSGGPRGTRPHATGGFPATANILAWAKENGHEASARGRIHQTVKDAYHATH